MGRLKALAPAVRDLPARVPVLRIDHDRERREIGWRRWYNTQGWRRLRIEVLRRDLFTCRMCGFSTATTSQLVADHVVPHRGDAELFWDIGNLQCLCKACHDSTKQRMERAGGGGV